MVVFLNFNYNKFNNYMQQVNCLSYFGNVIIQALFYTLLVSFSLWFNLS